MQLPRRITTRDWAYGQSRSYAWPAQATGPGQVSFAEDGTNRGGVGSLTYHLYSHRNCDTTVFRKMFSAFLTPVLGGILLGCCFLPAPAHWLAWISLVPVAAAIAIRRHIVATYVGMYCAGLLFNLITTDWIRTLEGGTGLSGRSAPDWLIQSQLLALFWPLTLFLGRLLVGNWPMPMSLALPSVWIIHELLLRSLWAFIDSTGWQVYFLGYAIVDHRYMSQIADLGGVSALSFVAACTSGATWDLLGSCWNREGNHPSKFRNLTGVGIAIFLLVLSYGYGAWAIHHTQFAEGPNVWLMPENVLRKPPAELPWQPNAPGAPDVLLWSELAYHGPRVDSSRPRHGTLAGTSQSSDNPIDPQGTGSEKALEELCRQFAVPLVVGYTRTDHVEAVHNKYNSAAFVDPKDGFQGSYDKVGLVPWTEFTPLEGLSARKGSQFNHGTTCPVFTLDSATTGISYRFATAICYDVAFPQLFRRLMHTAEGAPDFFLVCSSERSDKTGQMSRHALALAKVRAIECRRTFVRNVHLGYSGRIDSTGRLRDGSIPLLLRSPTPLGEIPIDQRSTLYILWGDWIPSAIICVVLIAAALKVSRRASSSRSTSERDLQKSMGC